MADELYFVLIKYSNRSPKQKQEEDIDVCGLETLGANTVPAGGRGSSYLVWNQEQLNTTFKLCTVPFLP